MNVSVNLPYMHVETINEIQRNCFTALSHETLHINSPNKSGTELYGKLTGRWDAKIITTNSKRKDAGNEAETNRNRAGPRNIPKQGRARKGPTARRKPAWWILARRGKPKPLQSGSWTKISGGGSRRNKDGRECDHKTAEAREETTTDGKRSD